LPPVIEWISAHVGHPQRQGRQARRELSRTPPREPLAAPRRTSPYPLDHLESTRRYLERHGKPAAFYSDRRPPGLLVLRRPGDSSIVIMLSRLCCTSVAST
jgi:hypothetical protein